MSPGAGFTEIDEQDITPAFLGKAGTLQTEDAAASNTAIAWTWNTAQSAAALVLEVKAAPPADTGGTTPAPADDGALVNRFETVLFFHPLEKFFPSDAKRYIEHAALWTAQDPDDDRNGWGGKPGDPFPRNPTVPAMGLAAVPNEPGDFRFGEELGGANDHRFLELGGWNDPSLMHEPGVTAQSSNRFSDRKEIAKAYTTIPELEKSRFWYHAEVIHEEQAAHDRTRYAGRGPK